MKLLTFDPGFTTCGWAVSDYDHKTGIFKVLKRGEYQSTKIALKDKVNVEKYGQRMIAARLLKKEVDRLITIHKPNVIVTEDAFFNPFRPNAYLALIICIHTIENACFDKDYKLEKLAPKLIKQRVSGSGSSGKLNIQEAIKENKKIIVDKIDELTEHEADAIGVSVAWATNIIEPETIQN
jgi:Holliday junction resolvasome RuvABC endonuclease subunit